MSQHPQPRSDPDSDDQDTNDFDNEAAVSQPRAKSTRHLFSSSDNNELSDSSHDYPDYEDFDDLEDFPDEDYDEADLEEFDADSDSSVGISPSGYDPDQDIIVDSPVLGMNDSREDSRLESREDFSDSSVEDLTIDYHDDDSTDDIESSRSIRRAASTGSTAATPMVDLDSDTVDLGEPENQQTSGPRPIPSEKLIAPPNSRLPVLTGRFQMLNILGYGSYGMVFKGCDLLTGEAVAIKILKNEFYDDAFIRGQWEREQELVSRLNIQGAPKGYAAGLQEQNGSKVSYIVTSLVKGQNLKDWRVELKDQEPPLSELADLALGIATALRELFHLGVIHRDIKPGNIMRTEEGEIKVMDFGLHRLIDDRPIGESDKMVGTPQYIPPEIISGKLGSFASDIYSAGLTLYFLVEGKAPYLGRTVQEVLAKHRKTPLPRLSGRLRGSAFEDLIQDMARKVPEQRPEIGEICERLSEMV